MSFPRKRESKKLLITNASGLLILTGSPILKLSRCKGLSRPGSSFLLTPISNAVATSSSAFHVGWQILCFPTAHNIQGGVPNTFSRNLRQNRFVFPYASHEVVCHSNVECAIWLAGENIDIVAHLYTLTDAIIDTAC